MKKEDATTAQVALLIAGVAAIATTTLATGAAQRFTWFSSETTGYQIMKDGLTFALAALGAWLLYRRTRATDRTLANSTENSRLDTFYRAAQMLGDDQAQVRSAGLATLEALCETAKEQYYSRYLKILRTYLHENHSASYRAHQDLFAQDNADHFQFPVTSISQAEAFSAFGRLREKFGYDWPKDINQMDANRFVVQGILLNTYTHNIGDFDWTHVTGLMRNVRFRNCSFRHAKWKFAASGLIEFENCDLEGFELEAYDLSYRSLPQPSASVVVSGGRRSKATINGRSVPAGGEFEV